MQKIDVAFVDIQLSDGLSFELFSLVEIPFPVIFTTAYDQYVLKAFQVHAIDYLLKPIKNEQLADALAKLERYGGRTNIPATRSAIADIPNVPRPHRLVVKTGKSIRIINLTDISYFYSEHKITYLMCFDGKRYAVDTTLDQLDATLDPATFYRANRQCIVSVDGIREMQAHTRSRLKLILHPAPAQDVIVSTEKASAFKDWLRGEMS
jgi:DNA-binding LytR/AlgR family response regulator